MDVRMSAMTVILIAAVGLSPCANAQTSGGDVSRTDREIRRRRVAAEARRGSQEVRRAENREADGKEAGHSGDAGPYRLIPICNL